MKEALKLALDALENSDKLINGSGNHFGLEGAMDGYYSGCFDVDGNNKLLNEAITAIKEALAQPERPQNCGTGFCSCIECVMEPVAWPCVIETADFEEDTVTLKMQSKDYSVGVGLHWLSTTPPQRKPLTDEEYSALAETCTGADGLDCVDFGRAVARHYGIKE